MTIDDTTPPDSSTANPLQARARAFLERPVPDGMTYASENLSDRFIAKYAQNGSVALDAELTELLTLCVMEGQFAAETKTGAEGELFRESYEILLQILEESTKT